MLAWHEFAREKRIGRFLTSIDIARTSDEAEPYLASQEAGS
jgi:hypothetical protein